MPQHDVTEQNHQVGIVVIVTPYPDVDAPFVKDGLGRAADNADIESSRSNQAQIIDDLVQSFGFILEEFEQNQVVLHT